MEIKSADQSTEHMDHTESQNSQFEFDDRDDAIFSSPSLDDSLQNATLIATLAERFKLTSFKRFQREVIDATLQGKDTLVVYPTGSGKSLCFQFPPVHENKKGIIITPTISLMQDQVDKLNEMGISSVYLGSAQFDKTIEKRVFEPNSKVSLIFVTPEWITKPGNLSKIQLLASRKQLSLIAVDEAHLYCEWADFRNAYRDLKKLKYDFPDVPIMALTATAKPDTVENMKDLLRHPRVVKASVNRPNIYLSVEELPSPNKCTPPAMQFARRAADIIGTSSAIIYTDFISDIGPIISSLAELGIEAVGYHGELDGPSRHESYVRWKSDDVKVIVATKAFGMGINKPDIRHIVRNGVPENMLSWVQEMGRAGRDGKQSWATILFRKGDVSHANAWVLNNLSNKERCDRILSGFSESWKYIYAHLSGKCRRRLIVNIFGEEDTKPTSLGDCCDVCKNNTNVSDHKPELKVLIDALDVVGCKGEVKIAEWIRGSNIPWTDMHDKKALSYGNHCGKDINFWRQFIKQCHVKSLIKFELKSMIKTNGTYAVHGVYSPLPEGRELANSDDKELLLPVHQSKHVSAPAMSPYGAVPGTSRTEKKIREGKGSHMLSVVRKCLSESENWIISKTKRDFHFPGAFSSKRQQQLYYISDITKLEQNCDDPHFLWKDIQLSKGQLNKPRLITADIDGKKEDVYYRSTPCSGIKQCPQEGCKYVVPIRDRRKCPDHDMNLEKSTDCPVEFVYIHPKEPSDNRRWIGGLVRGQKGSSDNLHNHPLHSSTKISQCVRQKISAAVSANPSLTTSDIVRGQGIGFLPSAADDASSHVGKVSQEVRRTKIKKGLIDKGWSPFDFERVADAIDSDDDKISGDDQDKLKKYQKQGRPYLVSAGIEEGIRYIFTMSPLMAKIASEAEFIQCDITYDELSDYPYLFNAVAFNSVSMEWMVIARVRLNRQTSEAYALAFKKIFAKCSSINENFLPGSTLLGVLTDWSDAETNGLRQAVGKTVADNLLKGCSVHWNRSCQRVADRVAKRKEEKDIFLKICYIIPKLTTAVNVVACFEALCGVRSLNELSKKVQTLKLTNEEIDMVDKDQ